jgi:hypothetical protein
VNVNNTVQRGDHRDKVSLDVIDGVERGGEESRVGGIGSSGEAQAVQAHGEVENIAGVVCPDRGVGGVLASDDPPQFTADAVIKEAGKGA